MFDWSYFNNSNWRLSVQRQSKVGMFDLDLVRLTPPPNQVEQNIIWTKSKNKFSPINVNFD
jgi:hypothetical protein